MRVFMFFLPTQDMYDIKGTQNRWHPTGFLYGNKSFHTGFYDNNVTSEGATTHELFTRFLKPRRIASGPRILLSVYDHSLRLLSSR